MNDFLLVFLEKLNRIDGIPYHASVGFPTEEEGVTVYSLPGGNTVEGYMNGEKLMRLPYEIAIKTKDQKEALESLWKISDFLKLEDLDFASKNNSFQFEQLMTADEPYIGGMDEHGNFVYLLRFNAEMII